MSDPEQSSSSGSRRTRRTAREQKESEEEEFEWVQPEDLHKQLLKKKREEKKRTASTEEASSSQQARASTSETPTAEQSTVLIEPTKPTKTPSGSESEDSDIFTTPDKTQLQQRREDSADSEEDSADSEEDSEEESKSVQSTLPPKLPAPPSLAAVGRTIPTTTTAVVSTTKTSAAASTAAAAVTTTTAATTSSTTTVSTTTAAKTTTAVASRATKTIRTMASIDATTHANQHNAMHGQLTLLLKKITEHEAGTALMTSTEVELILEDMKTLRAELTTQQRNCYILFPNTGGPPTALAKEITEFLKLELPFQEVRIKMTNILSTLSTTTTASKLLTPRLTLPRFNGAHNCWPAFEANFTALVVKNATFTESERLRLLVDALREGTAKDDLADLQITDGNWKVGWDRMVSRYDSPREACAAALAPLLNLPPLISQSESGLRKLVNCVRTTQAQLLLIKKGSVTIEEVLYLHFIQAKLDHHTINLFNQTLKDNQVPKLSVCLDFLETHSKNLGLTNGLKIRSSTGPIKGLETHRRHFSDRRVMIAKSEEATSGISDSDAVCASSSSGKKKKLKTKKERSEQQSPDKTVMINSGREKEKSHKGATKKGAETKFKYPCPLCQHVNHPLWGCPHFQDMDVARRREWVAAQGRCYGCLGKHFQRECKSTMNCKQCGNKHHTLLHQKDRREERHYVHHLVNVNIKGNGLLPTAVVELQQDNERSNARILLDSGSQENFITTRMAHKLKLHIQKTKDDFSGIGGVSTSSVGTAKVTVVSRIPPYKKYVVEGHVMENITGNLPNQYFGKNKWTHLKGIPLADPNFNIPGPVDMLLGTAMFNEVMLGHHIRGPQGTPGGLATNLGYIVAGERAVEKPVQNCTCSKCLAALRSQTEKEGQQPETPPGSFDLQKFWQLEELPETRMWTPLEEFAENHYKKTVRRLKNGQYEVQWPFHKDTKTLGNSLKNAESRWYSTERQLQRRPELAQEYHNQLQEYIDLQQMELVPLKELNNTDVYYIPHHAVFKLESSTTKVRIVFDASAKTTSGVSLNDLMCPGPTIQPPLIEQLIVFRWFPQAMDADIAKMYRYITLAQEHRDFCRILWRKKPTDKLQQYRLKCLVFGATASPFLAIRTLQQLAEEEKTNYPLAADILTKAFYVDDLMYSVETVEAAIEAKNQLMDLLATAQLNLRKWSSNSKPFLRTIPIALCETKLTLDIEESKTIKALGLQWHPYKDVFQFTVNMPEEKYKGILTKRIILSEISKIFDPLGLLAPLIVTAKGMMQIIWQEKSLEWDDPLPSKIRQMWIEFASTLHKLQTLEIPRSLNCNTRKDWAWSLHGFSDASEKAYAAVIYLRGASEEGTTPVVCNMVISKTRVAPLKTMTIPRLELQGAWLLAQLMDTVRKIWRVKIEDLHYWTDAMIVLHWIQAPPSKWKTFVANRVNMIQEVSATPQWHHVRTHENPADCASRGNSPQELLENQLWWHGPEFLKQGKINFPVFPPNQKLTEEEKQMLDIERKPNSSDDSTALTAIGKTLTNKITETTGGRNRRPTDSYLVDKLADISSFKKMIRVYAVLCRIAKSKTLKYGAPIFTPQELAESEIGITRLIQRQQFPFTDPSLSNNEIEKLLLPYNNLQLWKDGQGVFRVGGRLRKSELSHGVRHPMLLLGNHPIIKSMIMEAHYRLAHAGRQTIAVHIRQRYWIPQATKIIKNAISHCITCHRYNAQPMCQLMGQLPSARTNITRPFLHTGVDYAGPYILKSMVGRKATYKAWICLYTCMATRAIHLEMVASLSHEAFLLAFRRFVSRRGIPSDMYSDNGLNFVGANNVLQNEIQLLKQTQEKILPNLDLERINWHFSPPRAPSMGGVWEICVKLMKGYLRRIMKDVTYNWEEFETLLVFVESLVNSRPITPLSEDPRDYQALTPAHFLIGEPLTTVHTSDLSHLKLNRMSKFQRLQHEMQELWKRWQEEYVTTLQKNTKWSQKEKNLEPNDLVLLMEDNTPPLKWKMGRIVAVHPGKDKLVRVATIRTTGDRQVVRSIAKIAKIPLEKTEPMVQEKQNPVKTTLMAQRTYATPWSWISTLLLVMMTIETGRAQHHENPDLTQWMDPCSQIVSMDYEVPPCTHIAHWPYVTSTGGSCYGKAGCPLNSTTMLSSTALQCVPGTCTRKNIVHLGTLQCQTHRQGQDTSMLNLDSIKSDICSMGNYPLKNCAHSREEFASVPVIIINKIVYPVSALHIEQVVDKNALSSYTCTGNCWGKDCAAAPGQCGGDHYFCAYFQCGTFTTDELCECKFNTTTIMHKFQTPEIQVWPDCWGHLQIKVRREDRSFNTRPLFCDHCEVKCNEDGVLVDTPNHVPNFIKIHRGPTYIGLHPKTAKNTIKLTKEMMGGPGETKVDVWFTGIDNPFVIPVMCPTVAYCNLITCVMCLEKWTNISCLTTVDWIIISITGCAVLTVIGICIHFSRILVLIMRILTWPCRAMKNLLKKKKQRRPVYYESDEELGQPLLDIDYTLTPYQQTTTSTNQKRKKHVTGSKLAFAVILMLSMVGTDGCDNVARITGQSRECVYIGNHHTTCAIRVNQRIAVAPVSQEACLRMDNSRGEHLGTIKIKTNAVSLKCKKEILYYVPLAVAKCQSLINCYNLYSTARCHGTKCQEFKINDTVAEFKDTDENLAWSYCQQIQHFGCFWLAFYKDCHWQRLALHNPTREAYTVYKCAEWNYAVELTKTFHFGNTTTQGEVTLHAGVPIMQGEIKLELISVSTPYTPILNKCILAKNNKQALVSCSDKGSQTLNEIGEVQCPSYEAAQSLNRSCFANIHLLRALPDQAGLRCISALVNPERLLHLAPLPLQLSDGILTPENGEIKFEMTAKALMEIEISSPNLQITMEYTQTTCDGDLIRLTGCYSCLTGSVLFLEARSIGAASIATLTCQQVDFYTAIKLTEAPQQYKLILKLNEPKVEFNCTLQCGKHKKDMSIQGELQFIADENFSDEKTIISYAPAKSSNATLNVSNLFPLDWIWTGFKLWMFKWILYGIASLIIICIVVAVCKAIVKKLV